jgi:hypothetical protein
MPLTSSFSPASPCPPSPAEPGPLNSGPHGFSEILYAFTSQGNNNGSAFGGLTGNTPFYNIVGAIAMLIGRFGIIIPALALGGALARKTWCPSRSGTFRTDNGMFVGLTIGVILIIGGLTFFPAIALGPVVEQLVTRGSSNDDPFLTSPPADPRSLTASPRPVGLFDRPILRQALRGAFFKMESAQSSEEPRDVRGARGIGHYLHRGHAPTPASSRGRSPSGSS